MLQLQNLIHSAAHVFNARLITKIDFDTKLSSLNRKITSNKTKHLLIENELKKLKTFDSIYFRGKSHFEEDGMQYYLVFQPIKRYFKRIVNVGNDNDFYFGNLKDYLIKQLILLRHLIMELLHT